MNTEGNIAATLAARETSLNFRDSLNRAFSNARGNAIRWKELDTLWARTCNLLRQVSPHDSDAICRDAIDKIEAIAELDRREREEEHKRQRALMDEARIFEIRRQHRIGWAERVNAPTIAAMRRLSERLQQANCDLVGRTHNEADIRGFLQEIGDALTAMSATLALEARASMQRESDASKAI